MEIKSIQHASVIVADIDAALRFYCDVLGLRLDDTRPDLGYPGAWLWVGTAQQIHLLQLPNPDPVVGRPAHGGRDRHTALLVDDVGALERNLERGGIPFTRSRSGRKALFCRDPDGNAWEFVEA